MLAGWLRRAKPGEVGLLVREAAGEFERLGALPFAAYVSDPCDGRTQGTTGMFDSLAYRNDAAIVLRRLVRSLPNRRGLIGVGTCDKGLPAIMMAVASFRGLAGAMIPGGVTLPPSRERTPAPCRPSARASRTVSCRWRRRRSSAAPRVPRPDSDDWRRVNNAVPRLVDALPNGPENHPTVRVFLAGVVPEVMLHLRRLGLLNRDARTISGKTWDELLGPSQVRPLARP